MRTMIKASGIVAALAITGVAGAQSWAEVGDAPAVLPGQQTTGSGALTTITGSIGGTGDVDIFEICIDSPTTFRASCVGGATYDTQFSLYLPNGNGVTFDDDSGGTLQSTITGLFVTTPGLYHLAVSSYDNDGLNAGGAEIWADTPFGTERAPDGPGAPGPLGAYDGNAFNAGGSYTITLAGTKYATACGGCGGLNLTNNATCPGGGAITVSWTGATNGGQVALIYANNTGSVQVPPGPCQGTVLGLGASGIQKVFSGGSGVGGSRTINGNAPGAACGKFLQLLDVSTCCTSNVSTIN